MLGCRRALQVENFPALGSPGKTQLSLPIYGPVFLKQQGPLPQKQFISPWFIKKMAPQWAGAVFSQGGTLLEKETCLRVLDQPQVGAVSWSDTWDKGLLPWDGVGPDETGGYLNSRKHKSKNQVNLCWDYGFQVRLPPLCYLGIWWDLKKISLGRMSKGILRSGAKSNTL